MKQYSVIQWIGVSIALIAGAASAFCIFAVVFTQQVEVVQKVVLAFGGVSGVVAFILARGYPRYGWKAGLIFPAPMISLSILLGAGLLFEGKSALAWLAIDAILLGASALGTGLAMRMRRDKNLSD